MSIVSSGLLTADQVFIFTAAIREGLENAINDVTDVQFSKISLVRPVTAEGSSDAPAGKKIPATMIFPFAPPTVQAEDLTSQGRSFNPLVRNYVTLQIKPYGGGYYVQRKDFYNDVFGTLGNVPRMLARSAQKQPDRLLASLLRNGKTTLDYTNTNAFSTTKPISVNGAVSGTYSNLYTTTPLTAINLGQTIANMMGRQNEDGLSLNLRPDTLIVPPSLYPAAVMATDMKNAVFSGTAGVGNLWPGQANNTAAVGDNWVALTGTIKQIVVMPELEEGGQSIDRTTWYVAECMNPNHGGACGLLMATEPGFEFGTNISPESPEVFYHNRYAFYFEKYMGAGFGITSYLSRCES